jgi:predicted transcriptional regulator
MSVLLDQKLQSYLGQLNDAEKKSVLLMIKTFLAGRVRPYISTDLEQYNIEIDEALAEAEKGNFIRQEEMEKKASEW